MKKVVLEHEKNIIDKLIEEEETPKLGVYILDVVDEVLVAAVIKGSPADKGGVMEDDIIKAMDGEAVKAVGDIMYLLKEKKFGDETVLSIVRGDEELEVRVTLDPISEQ